MDYVYMKFYNVEAYSPKPVHISPATPHALCDGFVPAGEKYLMLVNDHVYYSVDNESVVNLDTDGIPEITVFPEHIDIEVTYMPAAGPYQTQLVNVQPTIEATALLDMLRDKFNVPPYTLCELGAESGCKLECALYDVDFPNAKFELREVPKE